MIIINDIMLNSFSKSIFCFKCSENRLFDEIISNGFSEKENGIFLRYKKNIIEREKNTNDIPFWEYQVNRIDSEFDKIDIIGNTAEQIVGNMFFISKNIVNKFKNQFPNKKIILRLQYEFEFNIAKIFIHTIVGDIFCDNDAKNLISVNLECDDENNIASLVLIL